MELEVKRVVSSDAGFVALPLQLIYILQQADSQVQLFPVLELMARDGAALVPWFVAWAGASSSSSCIEVPENLAECIGLPDHARVNVRVRVDVPDAEKVLVEPATEDDSEIIELHADYLENHILNKVGVVQEGRRFPVSVPGQGMVLLLAKSTAPRSVVRLVRGTELVLSVKRRARQAEAAPAPELGRSVWLRVQDLHPSLHQTCRFGGKEFTVIPTAIIYISSTAGKLSNLQHAQWARITASNSGIRKEALIPEKGPKARKSVTVRILFWDGVAEGHAMVSKPLRMFLGARLHAGVFLQSVQSTDAPHAAAAKLSFVSFRPAAADELDADSELSSELLRHKELISFPGTAKSLPAVLLRAWLEAQTRVLSGDATATVPSEAIISILELSSKSDRQINFLLNLEGDESSKGFLHSIEASRIDQPGAKEDFRPNVKVQLGHPQYIYFVPEYQGPEIKLPPFESLWVKGLSEDALKRLKLLLDSSCRQKLKTMELPAPSGHLIHGPPACGKTQLALALARELNEDKQIIAHWVLVRCAELAGESLDSRKRFLKDTVIEAVHHAPCLVLLDDLDTLLSVNEGTDEDISVTCLAEYLSDMMDIAQEAAPVAFVATVTRPKALPKFLCSSGRFDYSIELGPPGARERAGILKELILARGFDCSEDVTNRLAAILDGYDANDLEVVVDRAVHASAARFLNVGRGNEVRFHLTESDLNAALQGFTPAALKGVAKGGSSGLKLGWDDIGGLPEVRRVLKELLELPVKYPVIFANAPLRLRTGVLLYGPPGCGKTHIVAAAAAACSLRYIPVKGPELLDKYIGSSEQAVRDIFAKASAAAPCILFFDEFDAIAPKRGHDNTGVTDRVVNQLLAELDGVSALTGVFTFAATNRPDLIDAALLRPGRLDHLLFCDFPTQSERLHILQVLSRHLTMDKDVDLEYLSRLSDGFSGADLKAVLSDAELEAVHLAIEKSSERPLISMEMLRAALAKAIPLQESERQRFTGIYHAFTSGRSSNKDLKGKKATLA